MFAESYQIASYIVFIVSGVLGILGALAEFTILGAFAAIEEVKILRALLELKVWGVFASDLGFKSFESCFRIFCVFWTCCFTKKNEVDVIG